MTDVGDLWLSGGEGAVAVASGAHGVSFSMGTGERSTVVLVDAAAVVELADALVAWANSEAEVVWSASGRGLAVDRV